MPAPSYGGQAIFGVAVTIRHIIDPPSQQLNEFFGVSGMQSLWGGFRGSTFLVEGSLLGANYSALNAAQALFESYVGDGIARDLVDTRGQTWNYVQCKAPFEVIGKVNLDDRGYHVRYRAVFNGLRS